MFLRFDLPLIVMGCTEISLALRTMRGLEGLELVDLAALLARVLAQRAYGLPADGTAPIKIRGDE